MCSCSYLLQVFVEVTLHFMRLTFLKMVVTSCTVCGSLYSGAYAKGRNYCLNTKSACANNITVQLKFCNTTFFIYLQSWTGLYISSGTSTGIHWNVQRCFRSQQETMSNMQQVRQAGEEWCKLQVPQVPLQLETKMPELRACHWSSLLKNKNPATVFSGCNRWD